jgi:hypothetical protein
MNNKPESKKVDTSEDCTVGSGAGLGALIYKLEVERDQL